MPVKVGLDKFDFNANWVDVALETGLFTSLVLSTSGKPTIDFVMPFTVPVNTGLAKSAFNNILLAFWVPEPPSYAVPEVVPITKLADIST